MYMMSQRMKIYPEESMTSNITILSEAAARADDFASRFAQVEPHDDPTISLRRWLSNKSVGLYEHLPHNVPPERWKYSLY